MGEELLFLSLEIGFRHGPRLGMEQTSFDPRYHKSMADIVFGSQRGEVIADLLYAFTQSRAAYPFTHPLNVCAKHLVNLPSLNLSPRLRPLVIRSVELIGHQGFGEVGVENLVRLLYRLGVSIDDVGSRFSWTELLLGIIKSHEGRECLSYSYWELLVELSLPYDGNHQGLTDYDPQVMISLRDAQEWDRLACWICFVWIERSLCPDGTLGDLERGTVLLFRHRPDTIQKLEEWMVRSGRDIPVAFQQICEQGRLEEERRDVPL